MPSGDSNNLAFLKDRCPGNIYKISAKFQGVHQTKTYASPMY